MIGAILGVGVWVNVGLDVFVPVGVEVDVLVPVGEGLDVFVPVGVGVDVLVPVGEGLDVLVPVGEGLDVFVLVGVEVDVLVPVGEGLSATCQSRDLLVWGDTVFIGNIIEIVRANPSTTSALPEIIFFINPSVRTFPIINPPRPYL